MTCRVVHCNWGGGRGAYMHGVYDEMNNERQTNRPIVDCGWTGLTLTVSCYQNQAQTDSRSVFYDAGRSAKVWEHRRAPCTTRADPGG